MRDFHNVLARLLQQAKLLQYLGTLWYSREYRYIRNANWAFSFESSVDDGQMTTPFDASCLHVFCEECTEIHIHVHPEHKNASEVSCNHVEMSFSGLIELN